MEKNLKQENKEIMDEVSKNPQTVRVSNPIAKNSAPDVIEKKKVPARRKKTTAASPSKISALKPAISNPLTRDSGIVARINNFTVSKTSNKLYGGYLTNSLSAGKVVDYSELIQYLNLSLQNKNTTHDLFTVLHNVFVEKLNCIFTAFGVFHEKSKCINLKLLNKMGGTYSSKIFLSDSENPVVECFKTSAAVLKNNNKFLNIPYTPDSSAIVLPLVSINQTVGVMILGKENLDCNMGFLSFIANYAAMFIHNIDLLEKTNMYANTDTLTGLYNHRGFQEVLAGEIQKSAQNGTDLSIVMFDINNISKINRELGHAKGDEVIKLLAEKVKQNMRSTDKAGRYGSDEIAIILPNTTTADAKYLAEYITYTLSCCFVDDVGPVKVSVGISTYPESTQDQEKLLILTEQAVYISKARGYKEGMSAIVSSSDFNFWDDAALNSFAEVIAKRHAQLGINFEEELVHKFNSEQIISQNHLMELANSLAGAIDAKDPYTKGHSTSVSRYSEALARAINLPEDEVQRITLGALLHDVGKIGIPENVLKKPGKLEGEEWEIMKQHPVIGAEKVLMPNEALRDLIPIVKYHHEHIDGSGYPEKLKGDEIPLAARIVAVADTFHALISDRPYRKGMSIDKACEILKDGAGKLWDRDLVRHFISIAPSLSTII
ncbi:MAG: diguanylate cyclase [Brachyspira sp.]|nr:diguanylate cyclase [Brachyspira sp.]